MSVEALSKLLGQVQPPALLTIDADIPDGCAIRLLLGHATGSREVSFQQPGQSFLIDRPIVGLGLAFHHPSASLAVPFLRELRFGRPSAVTLGATSFPSSDTIALVRPRNQPPYLTPVAPPFSVVYSSDVTRPWTIKLVAHCDRDSKVKAVVSMTFESEIERSVNLINNGRVEIELDLATSFSCRINMTPSSDAVSSPMLEGLLLEGDGRGHFMSVDRLYEGGHSEGMRLMDMGARKVLMLEPKLPTFLGSPPAMDRIMEMRRTGELDPEPVE